MHWPVMILPNQALQLTMMKLRIVDSLLFMRIQNHGQKTSGFALVAGISYRNNALTGGEIVICAMRPDWNETWLRVAEVLQLRSKCERGVGAVITDRYNRIEASGYTGPAANWKR